ncbi:MAG: sugar phosphate isomerase/epimerase [Negativicutes bacterium]|nr:sugar phosphate isomerase/epimerase [Negativicutes bacterium]
MRLSLSNLAFCGFESAALRCLPDDIGLELFYEFGNDWFWEQVLKEAYSNRPPDKPWLLSLHAPCIAVNLAAPADRGYLDLYGRTIDFAASWQADFVVVHTNEAYAGDKAASQALVKHRLHELLALADRQQVRLLIENVGLRAKGTLLFDWDDYTELLADLPQAGALLDTGHAYLNGWNMEDAIRILGPRLGAVHLHDNLGASDDHLPVGCGGIAWAPVFASLRRFAPETTLVFEYANIRREEALSGIASTVERYLK